MAVEISNFREETAELPDGHTLIAVLDCDADGFAPVRGVQLAIDPDGVGLVWDPDNRLERRFKEVVVHEMAVGRGVNLWGFGGRR